MAFRRPIGNMKKTLHVACIDINNTRQYNHTDCAVQFLIFDSHLAWTEVN